MSKDVKVLVLRTAGTNCDRETAFAFSSFGAKAECLHINKLIMKKARLDDYHIIAIPGGFTYGDDIESGRILANEISLQLKEQVNKFVRDGKLIIGICNGFQVLVKAGLLPGGKNGSAFYEGGQTATLTNNDSGKFEDRWVHLQVEGKGPWLKGMGKIVYFPVAHAEGKFIPKDDSVLSDLKKNGQIAFRYCSKEGSKPVYPENPNGSVEDIAGITDFSGRILGLMPHPERHFLPEQHPFWTRIKHDEGDGVKIFSNGVNYVKKNLL
ncbi:MAG: phosphoribosylformylglycinamidine synthase I [Candidatus Omnitrophica bacterium]|nr:phosphoribosylformylglycinamidine synthase I [Candidatus Omnitrophota bacterium]